MAERQLNEQEQKEYDAVFHEWMEKISEIPSYEERNPDSKGGKCLDNGYNGMYTELEKIYRPKLEKILGIENTVEKAAIPKIRMKKFSDMIMQNPNGFPAVPGRK